MAQEDIEEETYVHLERKAKRKIAQDTTYENNGAQIVNTKISLQQNRTIYILNVLHVNKRHWQESKRKEERPLLLSYTYYTIR
jgi:hypothetical protein